MIDRGEQIVAAEKMYLLFLMCVEVDKGSRQLRINENADECKIPDCWSSFTLDVALENNPELLKKAVIYDVFKHNNVKENPGLSWLKVHESLDALCASACVESVLRQPRPMA
jgi:hypothetical protein